MNKHHHTWLALLLGMLLIGTFSIAFAQPGPDNDGDKRGPWDGPRREKIESVIIGKFATELDLTPDQAEKFFPLLRQHHKHMEDIQKQNMELRDKLDDLSNDPKADKGEVAKLLDQRNAQQKQVQDANREFLNNVSSVLTPQQVSKCSILLEEMPRKIHQFIEDRRQGRMGQQPGRGMHGR